MPSPVPGLRSPADLVGGLVYFGRMLDKVRLNQAGKLPSDYTANLGGGFDKRCIHFLRIAYHNLVNHVQAHPEATDEELFDWALRSGRHPDEEEIEVWNEFMRKRGWKDEGSATLAKRKETGDFAARGDIETFFQFIDADEGRF